MRTINLALVGATGMVGRTFIKVLEEKNLPLGEVYLFASAKSAGTTVSFMGKDLVVLELNEENIKSHKVDYALFSAGGNTSLAYAPIFADCGAVVIDNSSAWRMNDDVPLVVPQVNLHSAKTHKGIIANPNCSTIQSVVPLKALEDAFGLESVRYATYQAVSGSGVDGIEDLKLTMQGELPKKYPHPIWNNCLPHIDTFSDNGYTKEELKMIQETQKILNRPELKVTATCVRVPVENGHSVEIHVKLNNPFTMDKVYEVLRNQEGLIIADDVQNNVYPLASEATGTDAVYVGRIRRDISDEQSLHIWCVADNIRKGAASNAIEILEKLEV